MKNLNAFLLAFFCLLFWDNSAKAQLAVATLDTGAVISVIRPDSGISQVQRVSLYPNSATDMLHIKMPNCTNANVEVTSLDGKVLQSFIMKASETSISTGDFISGVYFIKVRTARDTSVQKFIKD